MAVLYSVMHLFLFIQIKIVFLFQSADDNLQKAEMAMGTPENVVASLTATADIEYFITESSISTCTAESKEKIKVQLGFNMSYKFNKNMVLNLPRAMQFLNYHNLKKKIQSF